MRAGIALVCTIILLPAVHAAATPYLIAYEGDVYPEQAGWERYITGGGVNRSLDNGIFTLQAVNPAPDGGSDQYIYDMQEQLNPDPGEFFFAEWRVRLAPDSASSDVHVLIVPDNQERAFYGVYATTLFADTWQYPTAYLDTTVFHTYRLESFDMVNYTMFIDGDIVWQNEFCPGTTQSSLVRWGDGGVFGASGSQWDFFRFGVAVPEPASCMMTFFALVVAVLIRKR
jgi:hypothetical protein